MRPASKTDGDVAMATVTKATMSTKASAFTIASLMRDHRDDADAGSRRRSNWSEMGDDGDDCVSTSGSLECHVIRRTRGFEATPPPHVCDSPAVVGTMPSLFHHKR